MKSFKLIKVQWKDGYGSELTKLVEEDIEVCYTKLFVYVSDSEDGIILRKGEF